jgi:hypothetical protein
MPTRVHFRRFLIATLALGGIATLALRAADEKTANEPTSEQRCFEMRTYHAAPGKLDALNARFRDHTTKLFAKHGMESIGYWTLVPKEAPAAAPPPATGNANAGPAAASGNSNGGTLVYILAYPSKQAAEASWKAFRADPEWVAAKAESEKDGPLVEKVESVYLNPTDYSPMK